MWTLPLAIAVAAASTSPAAAEQPSAPPLPLRLSRAPDPWAFIGLPPGDRAVKDWFRANGIERDRSGGADWSDPYGGFQFWVEGGEIVRVEDDWHVDDDGGVYGELGALPGGLVHGQPVSAVSALLGPGRASEDGWAWGFDGGMCELRAGFDAGQRLSRVTVECVTTEAGPAFAVGGDAGARRAGLGGAATGGDADVRPPPSAPAPRVGPAPAPAAVAAAPVDPGPPPLPSIDTPARTGGSAPNDAAVVIGLEDYAFVPDVPYARRDADAFYDFLVYTRGVPQARVQRIQQGGREHLVEAVRSAAAEVQPGGTLWVYFSGHGAANPSTSERMLLGDDVRSDAVGFASRGVSVGEVERLASAAGGRPMLVLDTCYVGAGRSGESILGGTRFAVPTAYATAAPAALQWNAAAADQVSGPLEAVSHGAFTYFAVGALRGWADGERDGVRDGVVTAEEAQLYVVRALRVQGRNAQSPVWLGPSDVPLSTGAKGAGPAARVSSWRWSRSGTRSGLTRRAPASR